MFLGQPVVFTRKKHILYLLRENCKEQKVQSFRGKRLSDH